MLAPYFFAELISFIFSLLLLKNGVDKRLRVFTLYCFIVLLNEGINIFLIKYMKYSSNHWFENFAILFFFLFYLFSCTMFVFSKWEKNTIIYMMVFFSLSWIANMAFEYNSGKFYTYSFIIGCIFISISSLIYMLQLLNTKTVSYPLKTPFFYIAAAYLLYGIPLAIIFSAHAYFAYLETPIEKYRHYFVIILNMSNVLMYVLLSISFYVAWNQKK